MSTTFDTDTDEFMDAVQPQSLDVSSTAEPPEPAVEDGDNPDLGGEA